MEGMISNLYKIIQEEEQSKYQKDKRMMEVVGEIKRKRGRGKVGGSVGGD